MLVVQKRSDADTKHPGPKLCYELRLLWTRSAAIHRCFVSARSKMRWTLPAMCVVPYGGGRHFLNIRQLSREMWLRGAFGHR
jgi:hypothetical protein